MKSIMKIPLKFAVLSLIAVIVCQTCSADSAMDIERQQQQRNTPFRIKRSLCNTFGGCGAKRSIQPDRLYIGGRNGIDPATDKEAFFSHKKEPNAVLIAEILNDLLEYMQANEGNKRGKHVFMVADNPSESKVSYGIPPQAASNEGDLQEAQVIYPRVSE